MRDKTSEERLHVLMPPFVFWMASWSRRHRHGKKESSLISQPFSCLLRKKREGKGKGAAGILRSTVEHSNTEGETSNKKPQITEAPSETLAHTLADKRTIHKAYPSYILATWFLAARSERANHYRRTRRTGGEVKHLKCLHSISKSSA